MSTFEFSVSREARPPTGIVAKTRMLRGLKALLAIVAAALGTSCTSTSGGAATTSQAQPSHLVAPSPGLAYAQTACASCHAVTAASTRSPNPKAPTFTAIANTPGMTTMALNVWLHSPHKSMPLTSVDPDKIEVLSDYLATLSAKK